ncbi:MAG: aminotransferase class I/II-fold pyridoxal phosphate-dependent enzyme [Gammaproteobacteria bacterium]
MFNPYTTFLTARSKQNTRRTLSHQEAEPLLNFTTNDYLGLSQEPTILEALAHTSLQGMGQRGSRLVMPNQNPYAKLEKKIAESLKQDQALIFSSGFQANTSALSALLDRAVLKSEPLVFSDRLLHASFHIACQNARVKEIRYPHSDLNALENLLKPYKDTSHPKFIITESLFGMDGDISDIQHLIRLKQEYHALLIIDEAHSIGCYGHHGYGITEPWANEIDMITGSFSKALGCTGGFVACSNQIYEYLVNHCAGLIYSNALPFPIVAAIEAAWDLLPALSQKRKALQALSRIARTNLSKVGLNIGRTDSHLIPILIGDNNQVMQLKEKLAQQGIWVGAIRPPSVPQHGARLRLCLTSRHTLQDVEHFIKVLLLDSEMKGSSRSSPLLLKSLLPPLVRL